MELQPGYRLFSSEELYAAFGMSGGGTINTLTAAVTTLQFTRLVSEPAEIIPPPGDGKIITVISSTYQYIQGTSVFGLTHQTNLRYGVDPLNALNSIAEFNPDLSLPHDYTGTQSGFAGDSTDDWSNSSIVLTNDVEDFGVWGPITSSTINAPGSGWAINDTFTVGDPGTATGIVDTVDLSGAILTYHLTSPAGSYTTSTSDLTPSSGIGTDATVDIVVSTPATGHMRIDIYYTIVAKAT